MQRMELLQKRWSMSLRGSPVFQLRLILRLLLSLFVVKLNPGRAIIPSNRKHPELEPMIIGKTFLLRSMLI